MTIQSWGDVLAGWLLGILSSVIFLWLGYLLSKRLARRTGQFDRPNLEVQYGAIQLPTDGDLDIIYVVPEEKVAANFLATLPLLLTNTGSQAAQDVTLEVIMPYRTALAPEPTIEKGFRPGAENKRLDVGKRTHSYFYLPYLSPGETAQAFEMFACPWFTRSTLRTQVERENGELFDVEGEARWSLVFNIQLSTRDRVWPSCTIHLQSVQGPVARAIAEWEQTAVEKAEQTLTARSTLSRFISRVPLMRSRLSPQASALIAEVQLRDIWEGEPSPAERINETERFVVARRSGTTQVAMLPRWNLEIDLDSPTDGGDQ